MRMDVTLATYKGLVIYLKNHGYGLVTFRDYLDRSLITSYSLLCIVRHDVDRLPKNALRIAHFEHSLGIKGTYYFRVVSESYNLSIMEKIAKMGHEVGYHYEDVSLVAERLKIKEKRSENKELEQFIDLAFESFCRNLEMFRGKYGKLLE